MPGEWGNGQGAQYAVNMDSNGYKLNVTHNDTDDAVTISNSSTGKALDVAGKAQVVRNHATETTFLAQNQSGGLALGVVGPSQFSLGDVTITDNTTITKNHASEDALTVNNNLAGNALKVNGKTELSGNVKMNAHVLLNGSDLGTDGSGFKYNSTGHGNGASIDFYIGGTLEGYLDSAGFHTP